MNGTFLQPVVFNIITIVAMLFSLFQIVIGASERLTRTAVTIQILDQLTAEGILEDETIVSSLLADHDQSERFSNYLIVTMLVAIFANVVANYLGRGRHHTNTSRIRELEAQMRGLHGD